MAKEKKKSKKITKKYLSCYYMAREEIGVKEIAEEIKEHLPSIAEKMEFWEAAEVIEIEMGEKSSIDIEKIELFEDEEDQAFLKKQSICCIFAINTEESNLPQIKEVFGWVIKKYPGFVCSDSVDFLPYILSADSGECIQFF